MQRPASAAAPRRTQQAQGKQPIRPPAAAAPAAAAAAAAPSELDWHRLERYGISSSSSSNSSNSSSTGALGTSYHVLSRQQHGGSVQPRPPARDAPLRLHELSSPSAGSAGSGARAGASSHGRSFGGGGGSGGDSDVAFDLPACECSAFHSLRCCTKVYAMLHRQIPLVDAAAARERASRAAPAKVAHEQRRLRDMFGGEEVPPELLQSASASASASAAAAAADSWSAQVPAASLRFHVSDFTLGNLKNQATRMVLPPTVVFSAGDHHSGGGGGGASSASSSSSAALSTVEYYFTSMQSGEIKRKTREKVTPHLILDDMLRFARINMGEALAALGRHEDQTAAAAARTGRRTGGDLRSQAQPERAWEMERDDYTFQLQQQQQQDDAHKSALPHYMRPTKNPSGTTTTSFGAAPPASASSSSLLGSANARRGGGHHRPPPEWAVRAQGGPSSAPSPHLHPACDIIAQFTFASDAPRFDDPNLPYTLLHPSPTFASASSASHNGGPGVGEIDPHKHPDILYLSARSLRHFLTVVNGDFRAPRALGVLQPFVRPKEERNTVFRVRFTALPCVQPQQRQQGHEQQRHGTAVPGARAASGSPGSGSVSHSASAAQLGPSSLPDSFHISVEARQNVLPLADHTGLISATLVAASSSSKGGKARPRSTAQQFSLAERAATFDASHLSLQVDARRAPASGGGGPGGHARAASASSSSSSSFSAAAASHILYPKVAPALASPPSATATAAAAPLAASSFGSAGAGSAGSSSAPAPATLVVPSGYPWAPSGSTAAQRLRVPAALQERLQACVLRVVAHINELYRVGDTTAAAAAAAQAAKVAAHAALQRELYGSAAPLVSPAPSLPLPLVPATTSPPPPPSISVGFLEAFFKIDTENNLHLLTVRTIKHLVVCEATSAPATTADTGALGEAEPAVRCAQCSRRCAPPSQPEVLSMGSHRRDGKQAPLLRPTSAVLAERDRAQARPDDGDRDRGRTGPAGDGEYQTPFYARYRREDGDEEEDRRRARRRAEAAAGAPRAHGSIVYGSSLRRRGGGGGGGGRDSPDSEAAAAAAAHAAWEDDRDLWPESHFNPPPAPSSQFSAVSERIQSNPLFEPADAADDDDDVNVGGDSAGEEDGGPISAGARANHARLHQQQQHRPQWHRLDRPPAAAAAAAAAAHELTKEEEAASLERALQKLRPESTPDDIRDPQGRRGAHPASASAAAGANGAAAAAAMPRGRGAGPNGGTATKPRPASASAVSHYSRTIATAGSNGNGSSSSSHARTRSKDAFLGGSVSSAALSSSRTGTSRPTSASTSGPGSSRSSRPASAHSTAGLGHERRPSASTSGPTRAPIAPPPPPPPPSRQTQLTAYMIPTRASLGQEHFARRRRTSGAGSGGGAAPVDYQSPYPTAPPASASSASASASWPSPPSAAAAAAGCSASIRVYSVHATSPAEVAKMTALYPQLAATIPKGDSRRHSFASAAAAVAAAAGPHREWDDSGADLSVEIEEGQP